MTKLWNYTLYGVSYPEIAHRLGAVEAVLNSDGVCYSYLSQISAEKGTQSSLWKSINIINHSDLWILGRVGLVIL